MFARVLAISGSSVLAVTLVAGLSATPAEAKRKKLGAAIGAAAATVAVKAALRSKRAKAGEADDAESDASAEATSDAQPRPVRAAAARTDDEEVLPTESSTAQRNVGIVCIAGC